MQSDVETIWTLSPLIIGDAKHQRIAFVASPNQDCRKPQAVFVIDVYGQFRGKLKWIHPSKGVFRMCYSTDGGKSWQMQSSADSVVFVDGSFARIPWHIATVIWLLVFIIIQAYCVKWGQKIEKTEKELQKQTIDESDNDYQLFEERSNEPIVNESK